MAFVRLLFWYVFCSQWRGGKYFMTRSSLIILCEYNVVFFFCNVTMRLLRTWNWISTFLQSSIKWHSGVGIDLMNNNAWMLLKRFLTLFLPWWDAYQKQYKKFGFLPFAREIGLFFFRAETGPGGSNDNNDNIFVLKYWAIFFPFLHAFFVPF